MAYMFVKFFSMGLARNGEFHMYLPPKKAGFFMKDNPHYERPTKTLILLHGFNGDCDDWQQHTPVAEWSMKYNLAIVMPTGGVSFFLDREATGHKYATFIGVDLINFLRETYGLAEKREETFIGGNSMGGFGALHAALMFPETFSAAMPLSAAAIAKQLPKMKESLQQNRMANLEYYIEQFGDLDKAVESDINAEWQFNQNKEKGIENPRIFMACGTEDFGIANNRELADFFKENGADIEYYEAPGIHSWSFWVPAAEKGIEFLLK